mmetsp:Transcript_23839/g.42981  ORF Transcript_23839/g.42981 Transcript_23839/m.42981 type:complete len:207 (-) Transcript_23839:587-1207(-)
MNQNVFRLDVPVHNPHHVKVLQCDKYLRGIEFGVLLPHASVCLLLEEMEELATGAILHHKVQFGLALERPVHAHDEGVVCLGQHLPLCQQPVDLVARQDILLLEHLHCIDLFCVLLHHHVHLPHVPFPEQADRFEVLRLHPCLLHLPPRDHVVCRHHRRGKLDALLESVDLFVQLSCGQRATRAASLGIKTPFGAVLGPVGSDALP